MEDKEIKGKVENYANLPYTITIERRDDQGPYYVARYLELPHFIMTGATPEQAVKELESEKRDWFEFNLKQGNEIPLPLKSRNYSGKIILRMSPKLHEHLIRLAELQGVSLNSLMVKAIIEYSEFDETRIPQAV
jgi:predicted HicB family RNase H-like nuclease